MTRHVVGIDLGTTNSVVATVDDSGTVVVLPNADGGQTTPSVVYFESDGDALVGNEAVRETAFDPDNGVRLIKRSMGTEFPLDIRGQQHTPESISALILRQLVDAAVGGSGNGEKVSAVITVPAYFGTAEREATHQAGVIAGLDVLALLDEPVAAAAHYGLDTGGDRTILVYDLGGGTFDTTVLRIEDGAVRVLATDGHHELGGADVDLRLLDLVTKRLAEVLPPEDLDDLQDDQALLADLVLDVEAAKKNLSKTTSREISVRTPHGRAAVAITRSDLDMACSDLYYQTAEIIERVLAAAGIAREVIERGHHGGRVEPHPGPRPATRRNARKGSPAGRPRPRRGQGRGPARAPPGGIDADVRAGGAPRGQRAAGTHFAGSRAPVARPARRTWSRHPGDTARGRYPHRGQP